MSSNFFIVALFALLLHSPLHATLKWEQTQLEFRPDPTAREVKGEFHFTNTGKAPVTIATVTPECGCTTATLDKMTFQPGEKGQITAVFTLGQRRGDQTKHIRVQIEGQAEAVQLTLLTHIPEVLRLAPDFVYWQAGEPPSAKTIIATVLQDQPITIGKVSSSNARIRAVVETVREGREYRIVVTPDNTAADAMAVLSLETISGKDQPRTFQAYAQVKPPVK